MPIPAWHAAMVISVISSMLNFIIMACFLRKWMLNASTISMWTLASTLQAGGDRTVPYGANPGGGRNLAYNACEEHRPRLAAPPWSASIRFFSLRMQWRSTNPINLAPRPESSDLQH